ncbi:MAG: hypothetical protein MRZ79_09025 [Bacteroidia bacterium]|nr:hypothetical protein [Bacteroidia bacterium]
MNKLNSFFFATVAALAVLFSACTTDPIEPVGPSLTLELTSNVGTNQDSVAVDSFFTVLVTASSGTNTLKTIEVQENGVAISDLSRLDFNGFSAGSNPSPLGASDTATLDWTLRIKAPSVEGANDYTIVITDQIDSTIERTVSVTSFVPFTEVDTNTVVLRLRNQAGPAGQGGLDLDTGDETGTMNETTHDLADLGIDVSKAVDWIQKIKSANGAELRKVDNSTNFADVMFKEQVEEIYNASTVIPAESDVVQQGDMFAVKVASGVIYLLYTAEVSVTPASGDNSDFYRFDAKF